MAKTCKCSSTLCLSDVPPAGILWLGRIKWQELSPKFSEGGSSSKCWRLTWPLHHAGQSGAMPCTHELEVEWTDWCVSGLKADALNCRVYEIPVGSPNHIVQCDPVPILRCWAPPNSKLLNFGPAGGFIKSAYRATSRPCQSPAHLPVDHSRIFDLQLSYGSQPSWCHRPQQHKLRL